MVDTNEAQSSSKEEIRGIDWMGQWEQTTKAMFEWQRELMKKNMFPLSGDVTQWIHAMFERIGQLGLFNISLHNSRNPDLEKSIHAKWSYGRQIGRIIDVMGDILEAYEGEITKKGSEKLKKADIEKLKASIEEFKSMREDLVKLGKKH